MNKQINGIYLVILGTRPEAIKLSPLILELKRRNHSVVVVDSGQQPRFAGNYLEEFSIIPDYFLAATANGFALQEVYAEILKSSCELFSNLCPVAIIVQGDTTTVCAAAHAAFLNRIPVAHVEAGLRTHDFYSPFPEEMNRVLVSKFSSIHFAPTPIAADNLIAEGIDSENIFMVGNTGIDALNQAMGRSEMRMPNRERVVFVTIHRRENHGQNLHKCLEAIKVLANLHPDIIFLFQLHPNPIITSQVTENLSGIQNVKLISPMSYLDTVDVLRSTSLLMTDSGGLQEEATAIGVPMVVLRESTERPEILGQQNNYIVEKDFSNIVELSENILGRQISTPNLRDGISNTVFGSGVSSKQIVDVLEGRFGKSI